MKPCSHDNTKELNFNETERSTLRQVASQEEVNTLDILTTCGLECVAVGFRGSRGSGTFLELQHVDAVMYAHQKNWDLLHCTVGDGHVCSLT